MSEKTLNSSKEVNDFRLKKWGEESYPVATRKRGEARIDKCPFCGQPHMHSFGEGHRTAHCSTKRNYKQFISIQGQNFYQHKGYFIEEY